MEAQSGLALSTGLLSGIDSAQLVDAMTARQKIPIQAQEVKQHELRIKKEEYQSVNAAVFAVEDSLLQLSLNSTFNQKRAKFSTEDIIKVTPTTDSTPATYEIVVSQLAKANKIASNQQTGTDAVVNTEETTISINGTSLILGTDTNLGQLKDSINSIASTTNVTAQIMDNRIILESSVTGAGNDMALVDETGTLFADLGLVSGGSNELQVAQDAQFTIDGLSVSRSTNKFNDVVSELNFELQNTGSTSVDIDFDTDNTRTKVEDFVEKFNSAIELIYNKVNAERDFKLKGLNKDELESMSQEQIDEREDSMREQILSSDSLLQGLYNKLRSISYSIVESSGEFGGLNDIGISTGKVGSNKDQTKIGRLVIYDETKFSEALDSKMESVRLLFNSEKATEEESDKKVGLAERFKLDLREYTEYNGILTRKAGRPDQPSASLIDIEIGNIQADILFKNRNLLKYQETLLQTFTNMETSLAKLQEQSSALTQAGGF